MLSSGIFVFVPDPAGACAEALASTGGVWFDITESLIACEAASAALVSGATIAGAIECSAAHDLHIDDAYRYLLQGAQHDQCSEGKPMGCRGLSLSRVEGIRSQRAYTGQRGRDFMTHSFLPAAEMCN